MVTQKKFVVNMLIVATVIAMVIILSVALPTTYERPVSTRLCLIVIGIVALGVFLKTYNKGLPIRQRVYIVNGVVVQQATKRSVGDSSAFFSSSAAGSTETTICSICLCETSKSDASSNCCQNSFHKQCLDSYWSSIGSIRCPNCRFEVLTGSSAVVV